MNAPIERGAHFLDERIRRAGIIPGNIDLRAYERADDDFSISVKPASSWVDEVDAMFRAGVEKTHPGPLWEKTQGRIEFRPKEVSVWAGINGHFKSTFTSQITLDLCKQDQRCLIASLEMAPARTMQRMSKQAFAESHPNLEFLRKFHAWLDGRLWLFDRIGNISPRSMIALCRYFAEELGGQHIVIDAFMKVVKSEESLDEQKQFMNSLCAVAQETGLHIHLVHHVRKGSKESDRPGKFDLKGSGAISDMCDNVFILFRDKDKERDHEKGERLDEPAYLLETAKQRNGEYEGLMGFWFHKESMQFLEKQTAQPMRYQF